MYKPYLGIIAALIFKSRSAQAFDPFTVVTAGGAAANMLNATKGIADTVGDLSQFSEFLGTAADTFEETNGLASDLGYESDTSALETQVQKMENVNSKLQDLKWHSEDLKYSLNPEINHARSMSQKIRQFRKILSISRKLAGVFGLKTKGSDKIAMLQQVKISSMMLDQLQGMRTSQLMDHLENKIQKANQDIYLNKIIAEETFRNRSLRRPK